MTRLSVGYLVPGHHLLTTAGPTRNVLSLAGALAEHADVTVAFRTVVDPPRAAPFRTVELDPGAAPAPGAVDDAAVRGSGIGGLRRYMRTLKGFVDAHEFDVVLEKSWLLSGYLAARYRSRGVPAAVVENLVRVFGRQVASPADLVGWARHKAVRAAVGRWLRRADLIIAETAPLARALERHLGVAPESVAVVGLGVDHERFQPAGRAAARAELGLDPERRLLLYFGVLDRTHDLAPLLTAVTEPDELHVLGDGEQRETYEELARGRPVVFHGRVPHARVPVFAAAADLCVAPYDRAVFPDGEIAYSTLKIPEAMACARPVATVPGEHTGSLVEHGVSGFLVDNTTAEWTRLLQGLPDRSELDAMGERAAARAGEITWERTAQGYLAACRRLRGGV